MSQMMSDVFERPNSIPFFDVDIVTDTVAFINPLLINNHKGDSLILQKAADKLESFFTYALSVNDPNLLFELSKVKEQNSTRIGYSQNKSVGHGPISDQLFEMLKNLRQNIELIAVNRLNSNLTKLSALSMFVRNFSYDSISDLTSQIICKELYEFTIETVKTLGFSKYIHDEPMSITYWDALTNTWKTEIVSETFRVQGDFSILIPKEIVEPDFFSKNPNDYIRKVIVPRIQANMMKTNPSKKPTQKEIIHKGTETAGSAKQWIRQDIEDYPDDFINYFES